MGAKANISGQVFGRWTALKAIRKTNISGSRLWLCECECGKLKNVSVSTLRSGQSKSCGCYKSDLLTETLTGKPSRGMKPKGFSSAMHIFRYYRNSSNKRGLQFKFTVDQFLEITSKNCHYCDVEPKQFYKFLKGNGHYYYNGIDRVNNDIGYILDNCVPCCGVCNRAKNKMTYSAFLSMIKKIHTNICT